MKIFLFIIVFLLCLVFMPDNWLYSFIMNNFKISGDGEAGMSNLDNSVLITKAFLSAIAAFFVVTIREKIKSRS